MQEFGIYLSIGTIGSLILSVAGGVWWLSRLEKSIRDDASNDDEEMREHLEAQIENVSRDVQNLERQVVDRAETIRRETGEVGNAIRQKIHEVEVWNRDNFVAKEHFERSIERITNSIEKLGDRLEAKIDRSVITRRDS